MPNRDGTGPEGKGSKTGRQLGKCEGAKPSSMNNESLGSGRGRCGGGRRGCGGRFRVED